jgi:CHAT domain
MSNLKSILLMAANPKGTKSLRVQEEERDIKNRLRLAGYGKVPIHSIGATRVSDIQQAMADFNPQIVHFSGHGAGVDGLVFEDVNGQELLVSSDGLADLFRLFSTKGLDCVVLNACHTRSQAEAISKHIDYVIGTNQSIKDKAAIAFAVGFYTGLGAGEPIEFAFDMGCNAIKLAIREPQPMPVLYHQGKSIKEVQSNSEKKDDSPNSEQGSLIELEKVVLQFVEQASRTGQHPIRSEEVKDSLRKTHSHSQYEVDSCIQKLLQKRELIRGLAGQLSLTDIGRLRLKKNDNISPRDRAFMLLKVMSRPKFQEVIFRFKAESYISANKTQAEQAMEIVNYSIEKEGESLIELLDLIVEIL